MLHNPQYSLNEDQASALRAVAEMVHVEGSDAPAEPVLLVHGVFGAGAWVECGGRIPTRHRLNLVQRRF